MSKVIITAPQRLPLRTEGDDYQLVLFNEEDATKFKVLIDAAANMPAVETGNRNQAEALLIRIHEAGKVIEAQRKDAKAPFTAMGKAIDDAAKELAQPLDAAKKSVQGAVAAFVREQQRIEAEARRRAAEEQARIESEARAQREAERAKAQAIADAEAAELAEMLGAPVEPAPVVMPEPEPVAPAPVVHIEETKSAAITMRKVSKLVIRDESAIPAYVGGKELRTINKAAVKAAIEAGLTVPGAEIIIEEVPAMAAQKGGAPW